MVNFWDMEDATKEFFRCSINRDFSEFDWDTVFENAQNRIKGYLDQHGFNGEDAFVEWFLQFYDDVYGENEISESLQKFAPQTDYICIGTDELMKIMARGLYPKYKDAFENEEAFINLKELSEKLENIPDDDKERAILFDEVIHAQHVTGDIFDELDIPTLKAEIDAEYASAEVP